MLLAGLLVVLTRRWDQSNHLEHCLADSLVSQGSFQQSPHLIGLERQLTSVGISIVASAAKIDEQASKLLLVFELNVTVFNHLLSIYNESGM